MVILFDSYNLPEDIYKVVFATEQQELVGRMLINYIVENGGEITKTQMSFYATKLHEGTIIEKKGITPFSREVKMSYNKRQFYDRILTPMKGLGLIDFDIYKKTYRVSERFNKVMIRVGLLWLRELNKHQKQ